MPYILSISGPIGSGKSSLIKNLIKTFNKQYKIITIPEFIDGDPIFGLEMLNRFIENKISSMTFQYYILDYYERILTNIDISNIDIILIEKLPYDSVKCFSKIAYYNSKISESEFETLNKKLLEVEKLCEYLPNYLNDMTVLNIDNKTQQEVLNNSIDIIRDDIKKNIQKRIILLNCNLETCENHISIRNRIGEDKYSTEYLKTVVNFYKNLSDHNMTDSFILHIKI